MDAVVIDHRMDYSFHMLPRRRLAGLFVIFAMVVSFTEALTAASCSMGTSLATNMDMDMGMEMPAPDEPEESEAPRPECPLSMPGSPTNCVFSIVVAPAGIAEFNQGTRPIVSHVFEVGVYQLLVAQSAFHPPKS